RAEASPEAPVIGWLRWGERIRLASEPTTTPGCASGYYPIAPRGYACAGQGIDVGEAPPEVEPVVSPANRDANLPYSYYLVKDRMTPEYHQLPSRDQQRSAIAYGERYLELLDADQERRAARFLAGEMGPQSRRHPVIARFLNRNFFVASTDVQVRSRRRFARTTGGGFVKVANLEERTGAEFHGFDLGDEHSLPMNFLVRDARPRRQVERADGTFRFLRDEEADVLPRLQPVPHYVRRENIGGRFFHRLESDLWDGPRFLQDWFVVTAEAIEPPFELEEGEPWIHVDLSTQTLVIYRGTEPVYVTLVSTGIEGHDTPTGTFTIHKKSVTDTMANLGPDAGDDAYRIQDVPWTQYFEGSFALHTAFWHSRFGLRRSHGCVNLAPADAHRVFQETWPRVPNGWHAVSTDRTGFRASRVHVTE
ncbi:MAG: L,D-transpeptidase, partial [Myxococcota bacterium]